MLLRSISFEVTDLKPSQNTVISPSGNKSGLLVLSLYPKKFWPILRDFDYTSGFTDIYGFKIHFNHFPKLSPFLRKGRPSV